MAQAGQASFDEAFVDFAVAVFQEDGRWAAAPLPPHVAEAEQAEVRPLGHLLAHGTDEQVEIRGDVRWQRRGHPAAVLLEDGDREVDERLVERGLPGLCHARPSRPRSAARGPRAAASSAYWHRRRKRGLAALVGAH